VPGTIGLPNVYNDIAGVFPGLAGNLGALSANIGSELAGELDPETIALLQNTAAQFGIGAGVPLSPFAGARGLRHLGLTAEAQKSKGAADLLAALPTVAKTLTVQPETALEVANRNATLNAAPDPEKAAREAQRLFDLYMAKLQRTGGASLSYSGVGGGAPRNLNAPDSFINTPWAGFPGQSVWGSQPVTQRYTGTGINWGTQGAAPKDLWANMGTFQGPEGGSYATPGGGGFQDWFNDPFIGGGGGMFGVGPGNTNSTDYWNDWFNWDTGAQTGNVPNWDDMMQPDWKYLNEWDADYGSAG